LIRGRASEPIEREGQWGVLKKKKIVNKRYLTEAKTFSIHSTFENFEAALYVKAWLDWTTQRVLKSGRPVLTTSN
jgi:hypothetical protein